jgi:hypothetical protein
MKYKVKIQYIYSDTVEVEANSEFEAKTIALDDCDEQCEYLYDLQVERL